MLRDLFNSDAVDKQLNIVADSMTLTNEDVASESMELTERLCSEDVLRFGCCEANVFKIRVLNMVASLKDKKLSVSVELIGNEIGQMAIGNYKVDSDKPTADRRYRDIVAYDAMYDIINADVAEWYNGLTFPMTLKAFRNSFLAYFGIEQEEVELVNDSMIVEKTVEPSELSGKTVITAICEINGCFGHIGRDGRFQYIFLKEMAEGLYPSNTLFPRDNLYPTDPMNAEKISKGSYISATYEDFTVECINKLQIRQEEGDIGVIHPDTEASESDNCYIIQGNFLVYGKSSEELRQVAANILSIISKVWYRPAHVEAKGNPCLEVGDGIRLSTSQKIVYTYILQRTLKGIQALRDTYDAEGEQYQRTEVNGTHAEILQLKGKTNKLTRTIEETRLEMADIEKGLSSRITANASSIEAEVKRALGQEVELAAAIKINADNITSKVSKGNIISEINQTAETVTISASKINLKGLVEADEFTSKYATVLELSGVSARLRTVESEYISSNEVYTNFFTADEASIIFATVSELDAVNGRFSNIDAGGIKTGTMSADRIDADSLGSKVVTVLTGKIVSVNAVSASGLIIANGGITINGYDAVRKSATIGSVTIDYWGWE